MRAEAMEQLSLSITLNKELSVTSRKPEEKGVKNATMNPFLLFSLTSSFGNRWDYLL